MFFLTASTFIYSTLNCCGLLCFCMMWSNVLKVLFYILMWSYKNTFNLIIVQDNAVILIIINVI